MLKVYNCVGDLARHAISVGAWNIGGSNWTNNETFNQSCQLSISGDQKLVSEASKMMDKLDTMVETPNVVWERAVAGAFPVVPDYLAGELECMRSRQPSTSDRSPIRVLVDVSTSGSISNNQIRERGVAILALVMALSTYRPVELYGVSVGNGRDGWTMLAYRINTLPLDLASACYTLTSSGFDRNVCMSIMHSINRFDGGWPSGWELFNTKKNTHFYQRHLPEFCDDNTLIVGAAVAGDPLLTSPLKWVNDQLRRYVEVETGE